MDRIDLRSIEGWLAVFHLFGRERMSDFPIVVYHILRPKTMCV